MKLTAITVRHLRLPPFRGRTSLNGPSGGNLIDLLAVDLQTDSSLMGIGFTTVPSSMTAATRVLLEQELIPLLLGSDPRQVEKHFARASNHFGTSEFSGLVARAYAPIDIGLWDLKARTQELPLWQLLGGARPAAKGFVSDLGLMSTDAHDLPKLMKPLLDQGAIGLLAEIGSGSVEADAERIHDLRHAIGESAWLGVTCRDKFDLTTALGLSQYLQEEMEIDWFEEPLKPEDRAGYRRLADQLEVPLVVGASVARQEQFLPWFQESIPRIVRADVARLGGITPWLKVAALAEAFHLSICPVQLPEVGVQLGCGLPQVPQVDWIGGLNPLFESPIVFSKGFLHPPAEPGLGLQWNLKNRDKYTLS